MVQSIRIEEAELHHFRGFAQSRIKNIVVTFTDILQILNSTNSSGKSTFISELNPFSIEKSLFKKDGYKRLIFNVDGKRYEIYSDHKVNRLIDLETGENLNDGGTKTQQVELVKHIFDVTPYRWQIAMGATRFIGQSRQGRRKWLEEISGVDFDYAFGVYSGLTKRLNGHKQSLKMLSNDLTAEAAKLTSTDEMLRLRETETDLREAVRALLTSQDPSVRNVNVEALAREIDDLSTRAEGLYKAYTKLPKVVNEFQVSSLDELRDYHSGLSARLQAAEAEESRLIEELARKSDMMDRLRDADGIDYQKVEEEAGEIEESLEKLRTQLKRLAIPKFSGIFKSMEATEEILSELGGLENLGHVLFVEHNYSSEDTVLPFQPDEFRQYSDELTTRTIQLRNTESQIEMLEAQIARLEAQTKLECPDCHHVWLPGEEQVDSHRAELLQKRKSLLTLSPMVEDLEEKVNRYNGVRDTIRFITSHIDRAMGGTNSQFRSILAEDLASGQLSLHDLVALVDAVRTLAQVVHKGFALREDLARLKQLLSRRDELEALGVVVDLDREYQKAEDALNLHRDHLQEIKAELAKVSDLGRLASRHTKLLNDFADTLEKLSNRRSVYSKALDNVAMGLIVDDLQSKHADITSRINNQQSVVTLVEKLKSYVENQEKQVEIDTLLQKALSPGSGVIAEQLIGYCSAFATQVTQVLSSIWNFEIKVLPCSIEGSSGLDYKFPLAVGTEEPVPDISNGSKSQRVITDLAVLFCTRISLGLNHLPLFLDEIADGLDEVHTVKLREFVRELTEDPVYGNILLVDHNVNTRNLLGECEEIVFDPSQVVTEADYNRFVKITRY